MNAFGPRVTVFFFGDAAFFVPDVLALAFGGMTTNKEVNKKEKRKQRGKLKTAKRRSHNQSTMNECGDMRAQGKTKQN